MKEQQTINLSTARRYMSNITEQLLMLRGILEDDKAPTVKIERALFETMQTLRDEVNAHYRTLE